MKVAFVFLAFLGVIFAGPAPEINNSEESNQEYILYEREDGTYAVEDFSQSAIEAYAAASDLTYHFFSRQHSNGVAFRSTEVANIRARTDYNVNRRTLFIIHGWTNHHQSPVNTIIRSAALAAADVNVFVVDWSPIASRNYVTAQGSVLQVGNFVGAFINQLNSQYGQSYATITLAGHSLGAHICGNAGAATGRRVGTIVGLDPAGPLFSQGNINNRIDPTDGVHVKIIHTNDGMLGFGITMGDVDYYPNGGRSQPGCGLDLAGSCAHSRAFEFYAESLRTNRFLSRNCGSYNDFTAGRCSTRATALMGGMLPATSARGDFYLTTNNNSPFARGTA